MSFISQGCTNFPGKTCWVVFSDPGIFKSIYKLYLIDGATIWFKQYVLSYFIWNLCLDSWNHSCNTKQSVKAKSWIFDRQENPLTSPMGDVSADEGLFPPPVEQTGAFQQEGRGQHVTRYCRQDIHCNTHLCLLEPNKPNTAIKPQILSRYSMAITRNVSQAKNERLTLFRYIIVFSVSIWSFL